MEAFLNYLRELLQRPCSLEEVQEVGRSPFIEEHELAKARYALLSKRNGLPLVSLNLKQDESGAIPLFRRGFFPWGALPYPREHAELGAILAELDQRETAQKMQDFQLATLDHFQKPIFSLFRQEKGEPYEMLERANQSFFNALNLDPTSIVEHDFVDQELGMFSKRTQDQTMLLLGSGCKSGMGSFLYRQVGVINFGPQLTPIGESNGFGLAGKGNHFQVTEKTCSYQCRLAAPHSRKLGLQDSGYSGAWVEVEAEYSPTLLSLKCHFIGKSSLAFSCFGKADACYVDRSHKLNPHSLDRYQGPPRSIELKSREGDILSIEAQEGFSKLVVIPLARDESFWGADFLIGYTIDSPTIQLSFHRL